MSNRRAKLLLVQRTGWGKSAVYLCRHENLPRRRSRPKSHHQGIAAARLDAKISVEAAQRLGIRAASIDSSNRDDWDAIITDVINDQIECLADNTRTIQLTKTFVTSTLMKIADRIGLHQINGRRRIVFPHWGT